MTSLRLPTTLSVIFGSFTLGLYVAIQGPTLMDLIDLLHVNNDIMSYSLAFASLAYSVGGLLSGFLFNYVNRQILILAYFLVFGISNIATPFISNYLAFSVITVFKMMCAGGTDCGANVWILEMWPGQDSWLQALHFSFAVGCALGPLIVEPFLSVEYKENEMDKIAGKTSGTTTINDQNNETRIHIPYGVSGLTSIMAALFILYLYYIEQRRKRQANKLRLKQQQAAGEHILLTSTQHPAALEAGGASCCIPEENQLELEREQQQEAEAMLSVGGKQADGNALSEQAVFLPQQSSSAAAPATESGQQQPSQQQQQLMLLQQQTVKITSKCREQTQGRPPYYVMFAIVLAALCLSFYCGIEITSMNYLATFAVNIDLQLKKSTAALMSSALTISFAVGRGFGIWIAAYMKPHKLFYLCAGVMATGNVLMLIFANTAETLLWYSICLFGLGCGPMFPAIVSFYDDKISKVTNTVSGIFILGSMFNVALNSLIIGHHIIDHALILIVCNLVGSVLLLLLFGTLHMLTKVKKNQRVRKFKLQQVSGGNSTHVVVVGGGGSIKSNNLAASAPLAVSAASAPAATKQQEAAPFGANSANLASQQPLLSASHEHPRDTNVQQQQPTPTPTLTPTTTSTPTPTTTPTPTSLAASPTIAPIATLEAPKTTQEDATITVAVGAADSSKVVAPPINSW